MEKSKASSADASAHAQRKGPRQIMGLRLIVAVLLAVNGLLWGGILLSPKGVRGYLEKRRETLRMEGKYRRLASNNQRLFKKIQRFKRDPWFQEKQVREELGWIREGEIVFEFPTDDDRETP